MDAGMVGGIGGAVIGCMGAAIGTYCSVVNATRPRERALTIRLATAGSFWLAAVMAVICFAPRPWGQLAVPLGPGITLAIPWCDRKLAAARADDEADREASRPLPERL